MNKIFIVFLLLLASVQTWAQTPYTINGYNHTIALFDSVSSNLTNKTSAPVVFTVDVPVQGLENILLPDSARAFGLRQTGSAHDRKIAIITAVGQLIKSKLYRNNMVPFDDSSTSALNAKQYAPAGNLFAQYFQKCGNFTEAGANFLHSIDSALFPADSFRMVNFRDIHTVLEYQLDGAYMKIDFDPSTPSFIDSFASSPNGFASAENILADTLLTKADWKWTNDTLDLAYVDIHNYRQWLGSNAPVYWPISFRPYDLTPIHTLCAGCSLDYTYKESAIPIDVSTDSGAVVYTKFKYFENGLIESGGDTTWLDSIAQMFMAYDHLTYPQVHDLISNIAIHFYTVWKPSYKNVLPVMKLHVPASADTVFLGTQLALPYLVTGVHATHPVRIDNWDVQDTTLTMYMPNNFEGNVVSPYFTDIHYLQSGFIPPNTEVTFDLIFNPRVLNFYTGFSGKILSGEFDTTVVTGLPVAAKAKSYAYPNPVAKGGTVVVPNGSTLLGVYNMEGKKINVQVTGNADTKTTFVAPLQAGVYFIRCTNGVQKLVVQ